MDQATKIIVLADFNSDIFTGLLANEESPPILSVNPTPYGQVLQAISDPSHQAWKDDPDIALIWTRPENVVPSFRSLLSFSEVSMEKISAEVDEFAQRILRLQHSVKHTLVSSWVLSPAYRGYGMLDMRSELGVSQCLMRMNLLLSEKLEIASNISVLNSQRWFQLVGANAFSHKMWYLSKTPFNQELFRVAASDIKAAIRGIYGKSKKAIVVDLDNTLWGGVLGDIGLEGIKLGGHDPLGEAFADFQHTLKSFKKRGILLAIVSKNTENVALDAIDNHPEMVLNRDDFSAWRINWQDKAQNVLEIANELNIGLQSLVFIDDNPVERSRIAEALPEVLVLDWPSSPLMYKEALLSLCEFDTTSITVEDRDRNKQYFAEKKRNSARKNLGDINQWLDSLETHVQVEQLCSKNLPRATQLMNKTNQMNLATRRMSEPELKSWSELENHAVFTLRVRDKFGDSGLTGILSLEMRELEVFVVDFVLSCRVMGRKIEETMLFVASNFSRSLGKNKLTAKYIETPKNGPCLQMLKNSGFQQVSSETEFYWMLVDEYELPSVLKLHVEPRWK